MTVHAIKVATGGIEYCLQVVRAVVFTAQFAVPALSIASAASVVQELSICSIAMILAARVIRMQVAGGHGATLVRDECLNQDKQTL